jgi:hypothetical protein
MMECLRGTFDMMKPDNIPPGPVTLGFASLTVSVDQTQSDGSVQGAPSVRIPVKPN